MSLMTGTYPSSIDLFTMVPLSTVCGSRRQGGVMVIDDAVNLYENGS